MELFQIQADQVLTEKPEQSMFSSHIHDTFEIFYFEFGSAKYSVEGNIYSLAPDDILLMNPMETHHLIVRKSLPYKRITVHFKPVLDLKENFFSSLMTPFLDHPLGCHNHYSTKEFPNNHWNHYLNGICGTTDPVRRHVYLLAFLQELSDFYPLVKEIPVAPASNDIPNIVRYIDNNISSPLTLDQLCNHFYISKSQINRNFRAALGTTVGDYILTKRLMMAKMMIKQGQKPSAIFLQCGFRDYSTFFKAYRKKFHHSPSREEQS